MRVSPTWVPVLMFTLLVVGVAIILLNYVSLLPTWGFLPDDTSNAWLLVGLAMILSGIVVATQWH
jgi:Cell division protein CrgA